MKKFILISLFLLSNYSFAQFIDNINASPIFTRGGYEEKAATLLKAGDELPADFPPIEIDSSDNPSPGTIFLSDVAIVLPIGINTNSQYGSYIIKLDENGKPFHYKKAALGAADFKMNSNGVYSFANSIDPKYITALEVIHYIVDKNLNVIDSIQCGNGYTADFHEFQILPNGNYLLIAWEETMMDLTPFYPTASPSSRIIGTVYQELDPQKHVVMQWRSIDNLPLDEFVPYALQANTFDQARGNSGFPDLDGNYIFSFPSTNEIMKVNRATGEPIWRLGGRHNQFTFINEHEENAPYYFSWQHYVHRLPNGNLLFFDNGLAKKPPYSRVVEYQLDEVNKTCTLVWEYRHTPDIICTFGGAAQRLPNENTFVSWGMVLGGNAKTATEVTPDKKVAYEIRMPSDIISYRSYKYDTNMCKAVAKVSVNETLEGNTYKFDNNTDTTGIKMTFERLNAFIYNTFTVRRFECPPINADFTGKAPWIYPMRYEITKSLVSDFKVIMKIDTKVLPEVINPEKAVVYIRDTVGKGKFIQVPNEYDPVTKELTVTIYSVGEFVIGVPYETHVPIKPHLVYPENNTKVDITKPVTLKWSLIGYAKTSNLQVASDPDFQNIVKDESNLYSSIIEYNDFEKEKTYYWRALSQSEDGTSQWSDVWNFTPADPYLKMVTPNGGEIFVKDTNRKIIRWEKNTFDTVRIQLFKNGQPVAMIRDTFYTTTNAFSWVINPNILVDSIYKIRVSSISNNAFFAESDNVFTIKDSDIGVKDFQYNPLSISNYPNPFQVSTRFEFKVPISGRVKLKVFDIKGLEVATVFDEDLSDGSYRVDWNAAALAPGIYVYRFQAGNYSVVNKMAIVK